LKANTVPHEKSIQTKSRQDTLRHAAWTGIDRVDLEESPFSPFAEGFLEDLAACGALVEATRSPQPCI
jgi:hypothetical protein